jgi:hypothetical protein
LYINRRLVRPNDKVLSHAETNAEMPAAHNVKIARRNLSVKNANNATEQATKPTENHVFGESVSVVFIT